MSLHILHSNRVEKLLENLSAQIATPHPGAGFLQGETVLLDNRVLGKWLNLKLAMSNTVAANIRYVQLSEFFWELSRSLVSEEIPRQTALGKEEMTWRLMGLLEDEEILAHKDLKPVTNYLAANNKSDKFTDLKRYQLASSVADLFDQYLVYRPGWISQSWDKDENIKSDQGNERSSLWKNAEAWQKVLWHAMVKDLDAPKTLQHRAAIQDRLLRILTGDFEKDSLNFHRLFIFGVTSMPEAQLDLLMLLGKHIEINLYVLNPCEHEWFGIRSEKQIIKLEQRLNNKDERKTESRKRDLHNELDFMEVGNPLLAGQAAQIQEFIELIYQKTDQYQLHAEIQDFDAFEDPGQTTLLRCIQKEILELQYRGEVAQLEGNTTNRLPIPVQEFKPNEGQFPSMHIHNCHSPQREVEVLHDQLLDMFNKDKSLSPRDVVVMMPKVAPYVPFINAVFESTTEDQRIRYHISDRTLQEESPILNSFETLLKLPDSRLPLSEILGLFEIPAVHRRFGLDRDAYEQLKSWLIASGVRWGLDATHRKDLGLPAYSDFSWDFGMNRLLAGYAMQTDVGGDGANEYAGLLDMISSDDTAAGFKILPLDDVEGSGADVLDSFLRFWTVLKTHRQHLGHARSPAGWKLLLEKLLDDFYDAQDDDWRALNELRRGLADLELADEKGHEWYKGQISLDVIRAMIQPVLKREGSMRHPWGEGVKFCSLLPMRGVPFKVVYLLGMNMDDYPRRIAARSFDLMRNDYRPGDRSARMDDRWLFLEALLSARQAFYVSYTGQDMHRNEKREPSVVLAELIDYVRDGYELPAGAGLAEPFKKRELNGNSFFYTRHPLQPYNPQYFQHRPENSPSRLLSYKQQAYEVANGQLLARASTLPSGDDRWVQSELPANGEVIDVSLDDFVMFFTRPCDWFFRKQGVGLSRYDEEVNDEEMFELQQGLGAWKLRDSLITQVTRSSLTENPDKDCLRFEINRLVARQKASGAWPIGKAAEKEIKNLEKLPLDYVFQQYGKQSNIEQLEVSVPLSLDADGSDEVSVCSLRISGGLKRFGDQYLVHSASKIGEKYLLDFYLRLALGSASPDFKIKTARAVFLNDKKDGIAPYFRMMGENQPVDFDNGIIDDEMRHQSLLKHLSGLYLRYRQHGLPFYPKLSLNMPDDNEDIAAKAEDEWIGSNYVASLKDDIKQRAYYGSPDVLVSDSFVTVANDVRCALGDWLKTGGDES